MRRHLRVCISILTTNQGAQRLHVLPPRLVQVRRGEVHLLALQGGAAHERLVEQPRADRKGQGDDGRCRAEEPRAAAARERAVESVRQGDEGRWPTAQVCWHQKRQQAWGGEEDDAPEGVSTGSEPAVEGQQVAEAEAKKSSPPKKSEGAKRKIAV